LVDQPEDNLDNGFIYGTIVDNVRQSWAIADWCRPNTGS